MKALGRIGRFSRDGRTSAAGTRTGGLLGGVALALVACVAAVILWLALSADDTMSQLGRLAGVEPPSIVLVVPPHPDPDIVADGGGDAAGQAGGGAGTDSESPAAQRIPGDALWQRYSQPFDRTDPRPRVAVIVTHLGLDGEETTQAIDQLPAAMTLAFSAYADGLEEWVPLAWRHGHEALLMVPMESDDYPADDPGPHTLRTVEGPETNLENLDTILARAGSYVGVIDTFGSRFTASAAAMRPVLEDLRDRGLAFVDTRASPRSAGLQVATEVGMPRAAVDLRLDVRASPDAIDVRLLQLETLAHEDGRVIATLEAYPLVLNRLQAWAATLDAKGLVLAPISVVLQSEADS